MSMGMLAVAAIRLAADGDKQCGSGEQFYVITPGASVNPIFWCETPAGDNLKRDTTPAPLTR